MNIFRIHSFRAFLHREEFMAPHLDFNGKRQCTRTSPRVSKLPHSTPKGEWLSHVFSAIVIDMRRSERQDSMKKCMVSLLARSNNEDISSFSLKGGTNLSALSRSNPEKSIRSLLDPIELTYECIHRERSIYPWQR